MDGLVLPEKMKNKEAKIRVAIMPMSIQINPGNAELRVSVLIHPEKDLELCCLGSSLRFNHRI